jgi:hypothetical protein
MGVEMPAFESRKEMENQSNIVMTLYPHKESDNAQY